MAVRRPLKVNGTNGLIEMSAADVQTLINYAVFKYGQSPAVTLAVAATGNLGNISDTRLSAGAASIDSATTTTTTVTASNLTGTHSTNRRAHGTFGGYDPRINSSTPAGIYTHQLWADNGSVGTVDMSFQINATGTYTIDFAWYSYSLTAPLTVKLNGTQIYYQTLTSYNVTVSAPQATFNASSGDTITILTSFPSSGWSGHYTYIRGGAGTNTVTTIAPQSYPSEATTQEPQVVTTQFNKVLQSFVSTTDPTSATFLNPCYYDPITGITEMTAADMVDTFISPAIDILTSSTVNQNTAGTYFVSTDSAEIDCTPQGIVFQDTRADTSLYSAAGIPESLDQPQTVQNYYLHLRNSTITNPEPLSIRPVRLYYNGSDPNGVQEIPQFGTYSMNTLFLYYMQYYTINVPGYRIRYNFNDSGNNRGSMTDTILNGTGNYQQYLASVDDYRSQEFPNGADSISQTHSLNIHRN